MVIDTGALLRTKSGLNMRTKAGATTSDTILAVLVKDALCWALTKPAGGWVKTTVRGWTLDGKALYFEPDERSGAKATVKKASALAYLAAREGDWRYAEVSGFVSAGFLLVVDGPT